MNVNHQKRSFFIIFMVIIIILMILIFFSKDGSLDIKSNYLRNSFSFSKIKETKPYKCPIKGEKWIVITSIFYPTISVHKYLQLKSQWNLIIIADRKTPKDWLSKLNLTDRSRLLYLSLEEQYTLEYSILKYLPEGSYARKNLGYLIAIQCGAKLIFESDDDNSPETNEIYHLPKIVQSKDVPWISFHGERSPFVNIYGSFGHPQIWPRGFPIDELRNVTEDGWHSVRKNYQNQTNVFIQQYLADLDPDVDAIVSFSPLNIERLNLNLKVNRFCLKYRLAHPLSVGRIKFDESQSPIVLEPFTFSPYNTQNTITYEEAFWGLILPISTTFRVCDIWRGYWVQRLLWDIGGQLMFGTSTVKQIRNSHSYIKDMDEEEQLYHQSGSFVRFLSSWSSNLPTLQQRIKQLTKDITNAAFWKSDEIQLMNAWIDDLYSVGYQFPSIISSSPPSRSPLIEKRAAVCVTGIIECVEDAWKKNHIHIRNSLHGSIDTFLFLSSSFSSSIVPLSIRLKQARSYMNTTMTILYEDRIINPKIPTDCQTNFILPKHIYKVNAYFQQVWALNQCYNLVKNYEQRFNIKYQLMIRTRLDILSQSSFTLERNRSFNINKTILVPPNRFFNALDDGFAAGPMDLMFYYMTRWNTFHQCPPDGLYHSETYLTRYLKRFMNVTRDKTLPAAADAIPHGRDRCH